MLSRDSSCPATVTQITRTVFVAWLGRGGQMLDESTGFEARDDHC
jgi:hypothetical protein